MLHVSWPPPPSSPAHLPGAAGTDFKVRLYPVDPWAGGAGFDYSFFFPDSIVRLPPGAADGYGYFPSACHVDFVMIWGGYGRVFHVNETAPGRSSRPLPGRRAVCVRTRSTHPPAGRSGPSHPPRPPKRNRTARRPYDHRSGLGVGPCPFVDRWQDVAGAEVLRHPQGPGGDVGRRSAVAVERAGVTSPDNPHPCCSRMTF